MKKLQNLLLLTLSLPFAACVNQGLRVDAGAISVRTRGHVSLQNAGGSLDLGSNQNTLQGAMDLGDREASPFLRAQWDRDRHRVRLAGFHEKTDGTGVLEGDFGGLVTGSTVQTEENLWVVNAQYAYQLLRDDHWRVAAGGQIGYYSLDINARSSLGFEQVNTDIFLPMPFLEIESLLGPLNVGANLSWMSADVRDASGRYWDLEAYGKYQLGDKFDVIAGYRYVFLNAHGEATGRDFRSDLDIQGWFLGAGVKF